MTQESPLTQTVSANHAVELPEHHFSQPHKSVILVADDDALVRNLVTQLMQREGYSVLSAVDGHEGLVLSRQYPGAIDLVITDVQMPRLNGTDLCTYLLEERPGIKALVMSCADTGEGAGEDADWPFLPKPSDGQVLIAIVRAVLAASVQSPVHWLPTNPLT